MSVVLAIIICGSFDEASAQ